ncbi:MAG: hypothetical protein EON93_25285 [Burkholderiales bacterium]|nr:MAG: hypothetical protein EON93_25285 [Burkholderiales bacterium]
MKKMATYLFYAVYVIFELAIWLFYRPSTVFDAFAAVTAPALALWIIYWTNLKSGEGLIGLLGRGKSKAPDEPMDG